MNEDLRLPHTAKEKNNPGSAASFPSTQVFTERIAAVAECLFTVKLFTHKKTRLNNKFCFLFVCFFGFWMCMFTFKPSRE